MFILSSYIHIYCILIHENYSTVILCVGLPEVMFVYDFYFHWYGIYIKISMWKSLVHYRVV